jgi:hypothetical protein
MKSALVCKAEMADALRIPAKVLSRMSAWQIDGRWDPDWDEPAQFRLRLRSLRMAFATAVFSIATFTRHGNIAREHEADSAWWA